MDDALEGYRDGRDPNSPEPSDNRGHLYRHCWHTGRREIEGRHLPAAVSRVLARIAEDADNAR